MSVLEQKGPGYIQLSRFLGLQFRKLIRERTTSIHDELRINPEKEPFDIQGGNLYSPANVLDKEFLNRTYTNPIDEGIFDRKMITTLDHEEDFNLIKATLFDDLKLSKKTIKKLDYKPGIKLLPGDILVMEYNGRTNKTLNFYSCVYSHENGRIFSFPEISYPVDTKYIKYIYRPNDVVGNKDLLSTIGNEIGALEQFKNESGDKEKIYVGKAFETDGLLQIGDIKFLVAPTQLSFVTQNGYQYFPTIRTRGNPKIPSMQEVKSLHISLIFPNESSINNQLLPLFAMFKRAPFVNLYNKDISNFFSELRGPASKFIPVALDSISIESVPGFPNTLQANISILPFQHRGVGEEFKALNSYSDVKAQQWFQGDRTDEALTAALEKRLNDTNHSSRLPYMMKPTINATYNFEESEPFRAFYQALISERKYVKDDRGSIVYKGRQSPNDIGLPISLETFRPTKEENKLHEYKAGDNKNTSINFTYTYVPDDIRKFSERVATERDNERVQSATDTKLMMQMMVDTSNQEFKNKIHSSFINRQDFFDQMRSRFQSSTNFINEYFALHNIDLNIEPAGRINGMLSFLLEYAASNHPTLAWVARSAGNREGIINAAHNAIESFTSGKAELLEEDQNVVDILKNVSVYYEGKNLGRPVGSVTAEKLSNIIGTRIQEYIALIDNENQKENWARFFNMFFDSMDSQLINAKISSLPVSSLPISEDVITIDNIEDVIEGWSINFSNKFIPMYLQGFKYPYYQHIGSDDINMSMSVRSMQNNRTRGLKEELSELNDRLQNSARVVMYHAPELMTDLDPRIKVTIDGNKPGNIFNVFNIKNLVFNGSNVSSVPTKPNVWNISMNLTQSNFTVKDYQNIHSIPQFTDIEDDIINLLLRSEIDQNGNVKVSDYTIDLNKLDMYNKINDPKIREELGGLNISQEQFEYIITSDYTDTYPNFAVFGNATNSNIFGGTEKTPVVGDALKKLNSAIMSYSFYYNQFERITTDTNSSITDINGVDFMSKGIIDKVNNKADTDRMNALLKDKPEMKTIFTYILSRILQLQLTHANLLATTFNNDSLLERSSDGIGSLLTGIVIGAAAVALVTVTGGGAIPFLGFMLYGAAVALGTSIAMPGIVDIIIDNPVATKKRELATTFAASIESILDGMKFSFVGQLVNNIIKDPLVRKELFGDRYEEEIRMGYFNKGVNCYNDFDIPLAFKKEKFRVFESSLIDDEKTLDILFSPDFYLYNKDISQVEKLNYANDAANRFQTIAKISSQQTLLENKETLDQIDLLDQTIFDGQSDPVRKKLLEDLDVSALDNGSLGPEAIKSKLDKLQRLYTKIATDRRVAIDGEDPDFLKFNLIVAARNKRIVQLKILQTAIKLSLAGYGDNTEDEKGSVAKLMTLPPGLWNQMKETMAGVTGSNSSSDIIGGTLLDSSLDTVKNMAAQIQQYFVTYTNEGKENPEIIDKKFYKNLTAKPGARKLEESVYTLINQLVLLSTAIQDYNNGNRGSFDYLNEIPELQMLDWFNIRTQEDIEQNQISLVNSFVEQDNNRNTGYNSKMFPTFKIFFVEEDGKTIRNIDDYYSYNAVQTIDIVSNKYSASKTAVIKLSNTMGHLTNKISLMRENNTAYGRVNTNTDNTFLGTLDIKPGTKIIIKLGYEANDKYLKSVFVGRIIEMNPGPIMELVCQSYGAQLNHHITEMKFGLRSSANEHGDVASAIIDSAPSMEGLGKKSLLGLGTDRFTGKNIRQLDKNLFEKFMVSSMLNRVNAGMFAQDNPRDDNIYLPYSLFPNSFDKMTFDWVVYDQSIWQALQEMSLYHRNVVPIVKPYNNDSYSTMDDLRETIVVGDKAGYYKYTDSFALSTLRVKDITSTVEQWNRSTRATMTDLLYYANSNLQTTIKLLLEQGYITEEKIDGVGNYYYPTSKLIPAYKFMRNRLNVLVLVNRLLENVNGILPGSITGYSLDYLKSLFPGLVNSSEEKLIQQLMILGQAGDISELNLEDKVLIHYKTFVADATVDPFISFLQFASRPAYSKLFESGEALDNITVEDVLNVDDIATDNKPTNKKLAGDPRYKKIQQHHLITDVSDIIDNNISLSEDFKNAVSIYYLPEPKFYNGITGIDHKDIAKLQTFTMKAFGDLRDGDTRLLESYQKNVDTNWWDIRQSGEDMLREYARIKDYEMKEKPEIDWTRLPSFVVTGLSLMQREIETMYRGQIKIVGNPNIEPYDIIHLHDDVNDMHGPIEVEEIIHSFSPETGFTTTITPSLITYDRDPISMADVETIGRMINVADTKRNQARLKSAAVLAINLGIAATGFGTLANTSASAFARVIGGVGGVGGSWGMLGSLYDLTIGIEKRYTRFIYDSLANVFGRDCINFSTLFYHGVPYMCGFDGVDYTGLKTLVSHQWQGQTPIQRLATANDVEYKWIITQGDLSKYGTGIGLAEQAGVPGFLTDFLASNEWGKTSAGGI